MKFLQKPIVITFLLLFTQLSITQAQIFENLWGNLNLFSVADDVKFGQQLKTEIEKDPRQYPILDRQKYASSYAYLEKMRDQILNSGQVRYKDEFEWEVNIIENDSVLNAFVTPGGYIYVYTGLIKFLDSEDELAGVLGHEIAHADLRHSTQNMTKSYGISFLLGLLTGGEEAPEWGQVLAGLTGNLTNLQFSRTAESEADNYSVRYLSETDYRCDGAAGFFRKMLQNNQAAPPEFLSTHPSSERRVEDIENYARQINCVRAASGSDYEAFKRTLP